MRNRPDGPEEPDEPDRPDRPSLGRPDERWDPDVGDGKRLSSYDLPEEIGSAWDDPPVKDNPRRPDREGIGLTDDRQDHVLDGEPAKRGGGHRYGTGFPGKTEFPADWDDNTVVSNVVDVAKNPGDVPVYQNFNQRWRVHGVRDGVDITVIVRPDGKIWTAWPEPGGRGVVENPEE
ncbi:MAG: hypothetical protein GEV03_00635 [Streptosporangiales bacterium]|nr:hypothetical protein [Streptosporangiales bacterium]